MFTAHEKGSQTQYVTPKAAQNVNDLQSGAIVDGVLSYLSVMDNGNFVNHSTLKLPGTIIHSCDPKKSKAIGLRIWSTLFINLHAHNYQQPTSVLEYKHAILMLHGKKGGFIIDCRRNANVLDNMRQQREQDISHHYGARYAWQLLETMNWLAMWKHSLVNYSKTPVKWRELIPLCYTTPSFKVNRTHKILPQWIIQWHQHNNRYFIHQIDPLM